ncbi:hypothetical protein MMC07_009597 [Pseudocyphellaria aurata]|nr:hypothetical protein [Pseudocyphellaria aurata]
MANPRPTLEGMITSCGPLLESIMQNLTPWEFRNLQLAGVRTSVGQEFQRRHQLPNRCNEIHFGTECDNTTESFDVRSCKGSPMIVWKNGEILLKEWVGTTPMGPCIRDDWWRAWKLHVENPNPHPEPNQDQYPIHTKICRPCRDASAAELLGEQLLTIALLVHRSALQSPQSGSGHRSIPAQYLPLLGLRSRPMALPWLLQGHPRLSRSPCAQPVPFPPIRPCLAARLGVLQKPPGFARTGMSLGRLLESSMAGAKQRAHANVLGVQRDHQNLRIWD